jgi:uncharacterized protein YjaZ
MKQQHKNQTKSEQLKRTKLKFINDSYTNQQLYIKIKNSDFWSNLSKIEQILFHSFLNENISQMSSKISA